MKEFNTIIDFISIIIENIKRVNKSEENVRNLIEERLSLIKEVVKVAYSRSAERNRSIYPVTYEFDEVKVLMVSEKIHMSLTR